jgi:hypothetical protein
MSGAEMFPACDVDQFKMNLDTKILLFHFPEPVKAGGIMNPLYSNSILAMYRSYLPESSVV